MRFLGMPTDRIAGIGPAVVRLIVGTIMIAHGLQKLDEGIPNFGSRVLAPLGVPHADLMAYVVTFTELVGGALLIAGLLSRLAALALSIELATTTSLVKSHIGLIAPPSRGAGAELDLALLAGFLVILLAGPGFASLDYLFRIETRPQMRSPGSV